MINNTYSTWLRYCSLLLTICSITGCGTVKEKTAPCKRPANLTSFAEESRRDCGPMALVNGDGANALAAIDAMTAE